MTTHQHPHQRCAVPALLIPFATKRQKPRFETRAFARTENMKCQHDPMQPDAKTTFMA